MYSFFNFAEGERIGQCHFDPRHCGYFGSRCVRGSSFQDEEKLPASFRL